jgi:AraC-like DNA-binding protein
MGSNNGRSRYASRGRIKANVLRRLTGTPLSQWPETLVECLDMLSTFGVCRRSALAEMLRPVVAVRDDALEVLRAPAASSPGALAFPTETEAMLSPHVRRICLYIRTHYGERISLESLAARVGRNTGYMATLFRRQTGMTIHRYLTAIRMQRAATLLRRCEKVEAVMLFVGYRSKKNFYRQFEATFGVTPGRYKAGRVVRPAPRRYAGNGIR